MKLLLINPNTSVEMTKGMEVVASSVLPQDWSLHCWTADQGVASIDSAFENAVAATAVCRGISEFAGDCDGVVIGCTDDPGLMAARELTDIPVVGGGEASFLYAIPLGYRFSVLTTLSRGIPGIESMLTQYGLADRCSSVRASDLTVLECEDADLTLTALTRVGQIAISEDKAEVLCLACAGMAGLSEKLTDALSVPVVDPISASVNLAVTLAEMGLKTSKVGRFLPLDQPATS